MNLSVAHFAPVTLDSQSGMGRVAIHWKNSLLKSGWKFHHFGANEVHPPNFKALWALSARRAWYSSGVQTSLMLAHEPSAEILRRTGVPVVLFSHGLERRCQEMAPPESGIADNPLKKLAMRPLWAWRARQTELGLKRCPLLLLINHEDRDYAVDRYNRRLDEIFIFQNGVNPSRLDAQHEPSGTPTVLFYGSWLERKGKSVLVRAAQNIAHSGIPVRWLLVGTGGSRESVLRDWPEFMHGSVEIIPNVPALEDDSIYARAHVFVMPSFFEGQPLTLLQAMESGRCVITTRCCGQRDIIRNGENGFLIEPGDADELAVQITASLGNTNLRRSAGIRAKEDMKNRSWDRVSDEVTNRLVEFTVEHGIGI